MEDILLVGTVCQSEGCALSRAQFTGERRDGERGFGSMSPNQTDLAFGVVGDGD